MRPIVAWAVVLTVSIGCVAAGCGGGDDGRDESVPATVAVGGVLDAFPPTVPAATTATPASTDRATTEAPASTVQAATTDAALGTTIPTRFVDVLADVVAGGPDAAEMSTQRLTDDTGRLSLAVPEDWSDRATSTGNEDSALPYLAASPDLREFLDGYDSAGLTAVVLPSADDTADALDSFRFGQDCEPGRVSPFVGARFSGQYRVWSDCGGTGTAIVTVAVEPMRPDTTVLVLVQIRGPDDLVALDTALDTLQVTD